MRTGNISAIQVFNEERERQRLFCRSISISEPTPIVRYRHKRRKIRNASSYRPLSKNVHWHYEQQLKSSVMPFHSEKSSRHAETNVEDW